MKLLKIILLSLLIYYSPVTGNKRVKRIVGGRPAALPPPDDPVVFIKLYTRNARVEGFHDRRRGIYSFLGIRYAEPPIGANRFGRPIYHRLKGDVNGTVPGQPCPQLFDGKVVGDEDCLWLNVFTPQMPDETTQLPVLMFIHGGGFRFGSANIYDPYPLLKKRMVVVPIQYRLGTFGIFGDGTIDTPGNVALLDMTDALRWITEYIPFFGGNPNDVTIIGQGSGGMCATFLAISDLPAKTSIKKAIAMSGTFKSDFSVDKEPRESSREIGRMNGCTEKQPMEILKCLKNISVSDIINNDNSVEMKRLLGMKMANGLTGMDGFAPNIDHPNDNRALLPFFGRSLDDSIQKGQLRSCPLLTGVTHDETANGVKLTDITNNFQNVTNFLKSIRNSVMGMVGDVKKSTSAAFRGIPIAKELFTLTDYLKKIEALDPLDILDKVIEGTTDVLFNYPAILATQIWNQFSPSFLYSFEYSGQHKYTGQKFLGGLPLVKYKNDNKSLIGHGDELQFLFELRDLFGKPIPEYELKNETDLKVRDSFTKLIADFVHLNVDAPRKDDNIFSQFSAKEAPFIRIGTTISSSKNFRHCQLSLWDLSIGTVVEAGSCDFLSTIMNPLGVGDISSLNSIVPLPLWTSPDKNKKNAPKKFTTPANQINNPFKFG